MYSISNIQRQLSSFFDILTRSQIIACTGAITLQITVIPATAMYINLTSIRTCLSSTPAILETEVKIDSAYYEDNPPLVRLTGCWVTGLLWSCGQGHVPWHISHHQSIQRWSHGNRRILEDIVPTVSSVFSPPKSVDKQYTTHCTGQHFCFRC